MGDYTFHGNCSWRKGCDFLELLGAHTAFSFCSRPRRMFYSCSHSHSCGAYHLLLNFVSQEFSECTTQVLHLQLAEFLQQRLVRPSTSVSGRGASIQEGKRSAPHCHWKSPRADRHHEQHSQRLHMTHTLRQVLCMSHPRCSAIGPP